MATALADSPQRHSRILRAVYRRLDVPAIQFRQAYTGSYRIGDCKPPCGSKLKTCHQQCYNILMFFARTS
eukprot:scaffold69406_cov15-Prasinocladus_malaysianus.AAC.1